LRLKEFKEYKELQEFEERKQRLLGHWTTKRCGFLIAFRFSDLSSPGSLILIPGHHS
jgi:hypothetical protein